MPIKMPIKMMLPHYNPFTHEDFLKLQEKRRKIKFREERKKKLEKFQEDELIKQIDIQYRMKKLISIQKLYERN
jgi:hypothetical protein